MNTPLLSTRAVLLGRSDFREADVLLRVFTEDRGKLSFVARGAKTRKKQAFHQVDYGRVLRLEWKDKGEELSTLSAAAIEEDFGAIVHDLEAYSLFGAMLELVDCSCPAGLRNQRVFALLVHCARSLAKGLPPMHLYAIFQAKLLKVLGYTPELHACPQCTTALAQHGGMLVDEILCHPCAHSLLSLRAPQAMAQASSKSATLAQLGRPLEARAEDVFCLRRLVEETPGQLANSGFLCKGLPVGVPRLLTALCARQFGRVPRGQVSAGFGL